MGDPAGVGPEVALRACFARRRAIAFRPLLVGDSRVWRSAARRLGLTEALADERRRPERIEVSSLEAADRRPGQPTAKGAEAAYRAILEGVALVRSGRAHAMVTAPVSKRAIQSLGHEFPGHTEVIADLAGGAEVRMMMAGPTLRVVLVTTHIALRDVPFALREDAVVRTAEIAAEALRRHFAIAKPRLALAGLNPHAGEGGSFGDEETRILGPALERARDLRIRLAGPFPADTVFHRARQGEFDAVISLYHDQGLTPFKLLHFHDGVNVTLGLPFPRTSPDHGTAFDIAGKGVADPTSMVRALSLAAEMASRRRPKAG
ncbi:MAG: 4-hydroxythreonine-4-phosphate dehydrogenase PdxA [Candidatus Binatia bacterium]